MKTIRVFDASTGDVQKERHLADRVMGSIAAEFNLPVSTSVGTSNAWPKEMTHGNLSRRMSVRWYYVPFSGNIGAFDRRWTPRNRLRTRQTLIWWFVSSGRGSAPYRPRS